MKFKIGSIIIRIAERASWAPIGFISKVLTNYKYSEYNSKSTTSIETIQWRLATQQEINAYNKGIRNISQIKKQLIIQIY